VPDAAGLAAARLPANIGTERANGERSVEARCPVKTDSNSVAVVAASEGAIGNLASLHSA
jgi:hypothetical protein